jgi:urea transport system ATP-binding protein
MADLRFTTLRKGQCRSGNELLLRITRLTVKVGVRRIIEDLSLDVFEGDGIGVSGPNGSGKSSLLNAIAGLEPARIESGAILMDGEDVTDMPPHERARRGLAFLRQRSNVFLDLTVEENMRLAAGPDGPARLVESYPAWSKHLPAYRRVGLLSGGQRQRLAWAMATLRPSRLLLMDEPEAGLSEGAPWPSKRTFLVVSHMIPRESEMLGRDFYSTPIGGGTTYE